MSFKYKEDLYKNYFSWLYPFSNENIAAYYSKINFKDKKVLTVTSSGDHILNAIMCGAKEIDAFDVNPLAKYYSELKIAAIKALSLEEFILFFYGKNIFKSPKYFLNKDTYMNKIRNCLNGENKIFWDHVFNQYTSKDLRRSFLFTDDYCDLKILLKTNLYLNEEGYSLLRSKLNDIKIDYYDKDIKDFKQVDKKYDVLVLSNIPAFVDDMFSSNQLEELRQIILNLTHNDSVVVLNYYYDNMFKDYTNNSMMYNLKNVKKIFPEFEYISFTSASNDRPVMGLFEKSKDGVMVSKKR